MFGRRFDVRSTIAVLALAVFVSSCNNSQSQARGEKEEGGPVREQTLTVTQSQAVARQVPAFVQATGSMTADETSSVAPKVAGKVVNVSVNVGQFVRQGAVIAKIDDRDAVLRLAEARAGVKQAEAAVRQAEARLGLSPNGSFNASAIPEVRAAGANYEQAQSEFRQAEANEKRYRELVESGDVAVITYEQFRTQRDTARTRANAAKEQLDAAVNTAKQNNQAIKSAQASVESARAQVATAEQAVADTVVVAPFSGFVSERQVAVGEYVSSASVIAILVRTNPIKIQIQVAEADIPYIVIGRGVSLEVEAYKDRKFAGTVTAVNPSVDPVSRAAIVEAQIENGDNALRAGMFATARINREGGTVGVFVPKSAILSDPTTQSYRIFVIQEGVAKLKVVQIGMEEAEMTQVLSGINADEFVATSALDQLYEGAKVTVAQ